MTNLPIRFWRAVLNRLIRAIYFSPSILLSCLKVRFVVINHPDRIGHLCLEPDCFIKEGELGARPYYRGIILIPKESAANQELLALWSQRITVISSNLWCSLLRPFLRFPRMRYETHQYAVAIGSTAQCAKIYAEWGRRAPLLALSDSDKIRGLDRLEQLGVPKDAWYVCIHSRDGGFSPNDEHLHSFRNSNIEHYIPAMQAIVKRGGWCIRVGEETSRPLSPLENVIDYAHSPLKSDWMDVYLCASCLFFLGNSSGLFLLSTVFGKHTASANMVPVSNALPLGFDDLGIPKLLRHHGQLMDYSQILNSPVANFRFASQYKEHEILVEENSPEEIRDLAIEMLDRSQGTAKYGDLDEELQRKFQNLIRPGHYSFGANSRVGRDFLRQYSSLI